MGSSETGGGLVDCSVGSIVWVRRRNGSWWPGKILGPEELANSQVTSPRSGTPVKLLGREDASVDWYNLEKSKRVKSFRCGEFDDCIERAEAAQGMPPKKREKYARREDAIMHALDLERQILEKKYGKMGNSSNGRSRRTSPDAVTSSVHLGNGSGNQNDSRSDNLPQRVGSSIAKKSASDQNPYEERVKEGNQLSGDDDSVGVVPRMRGLQDFGLRTVPPAREDLSVVASRAKRIRNAYLPYDSGDYLIDDRSLSSQVEIPVSKIEESSSYPAGMGENHISGSTEDTETDCSETDSLESNSDDDMMALSDDSASIELQPKYPRRIEPQEEHASISSSDEFDDLAFPDGSSHPTNSGVSKWKQKRKRNNRDQKLPEAARGYVNSRSGSVSEQYRNHISRYGSDFEGVCLNNQSAMRGGYWDDEYSSMLLEVDLKVEGNNYRRDVPMISLMSKMNGHAIVGHPIQIEALESGLIEAQNQLTSVWRTRRRTANSRVPRTFSSKLVQIGNAAARVACIPVKLVFSRLQEELQ